MIIDASLNIYEYEQILLGKETRFKLSFGTTKVKKSLSPDVIGPEDPDEYKDDAVTHTVMTEAAKDRTLGIIWRYALTKMLGWDANTARTQLTDSVAQLLRLDMTLEKNNITNSSAYQTSFAKILAAAYPNELKQSEQSYALDVYKHKARLEKYKNEKSDYNYPKKYFTGAIGQKRAGWMLMYAIGLYCEAEMTDEELYKFFGNKSRASRWLRRRCLDKVQMTVYPTPLDYFHYSLPPARRNEVLYQALRISEYVKKTIKSENKAKKTDAKSDVTDHDLVTA